MFTHLHVNLRPSLQGGLLVKLLSSETVLTLVEGASERLTAMTGSVGG